MHELHEPKKVDVLGVRVDLIDTSALHAAISDYIENRRHALALNVNIYALNLAYQDARFRGFLNQAEIVRCDGKGVMLGARALGHRIPERITFADWAWQLAEFAAERNFTFFLLGARPGVAEKAADRLRQRVPRLKIVGTHHGYFEKKAGSPENEAVIKKINDAKPNILIVCFGMPLQEHWLRGNWARLETNVAMVEGAGLDYISGELRRGPRWMLDHGLEWLARLIIEPRRLWRRYLIGNPLFFWRICKQRLGWVGFSPR